MPRETIARYEIRSELGRGGMAVVYLAYDPNFRRNVALKLVSGNLQDTASFRERFEREAHLIAKIEHPAIVPVYDYGEQDDQLYLVMRYMPGGALTSKIKEGVLSLGYSTQIISQIAPALDAVHAQGIVHRDLKPGNILLDNFGNPAISDFGIAHFSAATSDLTGSAVIGTPSYMSPEQVRADADLDGRSDIYALGAILFEMLTGRGPFQANTPMSVALKHLTDPLPSIRMFRPDLPAELESILTKAMAKDREMRYATASELASALRAIPGAAENKNTHPEGRFSIPRNNQEASTEVEMTDDAGMSNRPSYPQPASGPTDREVLQPISVSPSSGQTADAKKPINRALQILLMAGVAAVLLFACGSMGLLGTWAGLVLPGLFPEQAVSPTPTESESVNSPNNILFSDDFSDPGSGWPSDQTSYSEYGYQSGGYRILAMEEGSIPWVSTDIAYENISLSVDAKPISSSPNGYYGLLCRMQNEQNFYYLVLGSDGGFDIGKFKNGEPRSLFPEGLQYSDSINRGNQTNRIKADCKGNTLRLYANDIFLGEATDTDFNSGFSGMSINALDSQGFEVIFDNFLITATDQ